MLRLSLFLLAVTALLTGKTNLAAADGEELWDAPPFTVDAKELADTSQARPFPEHQSVEVLLHEGRFRFDDQGRLTRRIHRIYRVATEEAAQEWASSKSTWAPWHERRPVIRARVIRPDGQQFDLDPNTISESAQHQDSDLILSDRRMVHAPLPGLTAGAIVEEDIEVAEERCFCPAGRLEHFPLTGFFGTRRSKVIIEAPNDMRLSHGVRGIDCQPVETRNESTTTIVYDFQAVPAPRNIEPHRGLEAINIPIVVLCTGSSWGDIARHYADLIESQFEQEPAQKLARQVLAGDESRIEAAQKLLAKMREQLRYTGLEFGESSIIPYLPSEMLARGYGDCKDQATLLVTLLKEAGFEAKLALLNAGNSFDISSDFPGLNAFNHAIVYVPGEPPLWIDPTSPYCAPGVLPLGDQGRQALIVDRSTTELTVIPRSPSSENVIADRNVIEMADPGLAHVEETSSWQGSSAASPRSYYGQSSRADLDKFWKDRIQENYGSGELESLQFGESGAVSVPFEVQARIKNVGWGFTGTSEARFGVSVTTLFDRVPWYLHQPESEEEADGDRFFASEQPRKAPFHWPEPHVREVTFRVTPPAGYVLQSLPENLTETFGTAIYQQFFEQDGETASVTFRFDTGNEPLTPEAFNQLREMISSLVKQDESDGFTTLFVWDHSARQTLSDGQIQQAFSEYRSLIAAHPTDLIHVKGYVEALMQHGFGLEARRIAQQGVERVPESATAYYILGLACMHDELGRLIHPGADLQRGEQAYRKCLELDPNSTEAQFDLAVLTEHDSHGNRYAQERLPEAVQIYESILKNKKATDHHLAAAGNLTICLYHLQEYDKLAELVKTHSSIQAELQTALTALRRGTAAARRQAEAKCSNAAERHLHLFRVGAILESGRHYALAAEFYRIGAAAIPNRRQVDQLIDRQKKLKHLEEIQVESDQPEYPLQQLIITLLSFGVDEEKLDPYVTNRKFHESQELLHLGKFLAGARQKFHQSAASPLRRADTVSLLKLEREGTPEVGFRVQVRHDVAKLLPIYVVPTGTADSPSYRILPSGSARSALGEHALALLEDGQTAAARQWLNWARQDLPAGVFWDPLAGEPLAKIWSGSDKEPPELLKTASAVLAAPGGHEPAAQILEAALVSTENPFHKIQIQRALIQHYQQRHAYGKAAALLNTLMDGNSQSAELRPRWLFACWKENQSADVLAEVRGLAQKNSASSLLQFSIMTQILSEAGEAEKEVVRDYLRKQAAKHSSDPRYLNAAAWHELESRPIPESALDHARQACEVTQFQMPEVLNTYAALLAEQGELAQALHVLSQAVDAQVEERPGPADWFVIGRMAESCNLNEAAREAYQKASASEDSTIRRLVPRYLETLESQTPQSH